MTSTPQWVLDKIEQYLKEGETELDLMPRDHPRLTVLPPEVLTLKNLTALDLINNNLTHLPPEIAQLSNLTALDLSNNNLTHLPPAVTQLNNLNWLSLRNNNLTNLSPAIAQLSNLSTLVLNNNNLSDLPPEIAQLSKLTSLYLRNNKLSDLPPAIAQLNNLTDLYLNNNNLSDLPPAIAQLSNLTILDLENNNLSDLPSAIAQLSNLTILDLGNNHLTHLPVGVLKLPQLHTLRAAGNPWQSPPLPIFRFQQDTLVRARQFGALADLDSLRAYFAQKEKYGSHAVQEAKLLILGEPGAGKTTLARKLMDGRAPMPEMAESTQGIDVLHWQPENEPDLHIHLWDFGGQEIYKATHQFFLSHRAVYVLLSDVRKENTDFYDWLHLQRTLGGDSPVLIVQNEVADRSRTINMGVLTERFPNLQGKALATNLLSQRGLDAVRDELLLRVRQLPHMGAEWLNTWVTVREALEALSAKGTPFIDYAQYQEICHDNEIEHPDDQAYLSRFLHDLGVILHFHEDPALNHLVILSTKWATTAVYAIFDNAQINKQHGQFTLADMQHVLADARYAGKHVELMHLMQRFQLCYSLPHPPQHYIAPQLLQDQPPTYDWDAENNLIVRYRYGDYMPQGILTRLIVALHADIEDDEVVWRSGVVFAKNGSRAEVVEEHGARLLTIRMKGTHDKQLMTAIMHELRKIHQTFSHLSLNIELPCICEKCTAAPLPDDKHFFTLDLLMTRLMHNRSDIDCGKHVLSVQIPQLLQAVLDINWPEFQLLFSSDKIQTALDLTRAADYSSMLLEGHALLRNYLAEHPDLLAKEDRLGLLGGDASATEVYISYAWAEEDNANGIELIETLEKRLAEENIDVRRDVHDVGYKDSIREFMEAIGAGKAVIVVLSEKYLHSQYCMHELVEVLQNQNVRARIFPIVLGDAKISDTLVHADYLIYWEKKIAILEEKIRGMKSIANADGLKIWLDRYVAIRNEASDLMGIISDMNTLSPQRHEEEDFKSIITKVKERLA